MGGGTTVKHLLANWKMHTTVDQAVALVQVIQEGLRERASRGQRLPRVIVCPPLVSLVPLRAMVDQRLAGIIPILFVGEDEPGAGARSQTEHRLIQGISHIDLGQQPVLVVYEPAWAIGADRAADAEYVREMVAGLKDLLRRLGASDPEVLYGGTVNKENIEQFTRLDVLDGVGATRASLDAQGFLAMIDRMADAG